MSKIHLVKNHDPFFFSRAYLSHYFFGDLYMKIVIFIGRVYNVQEQVSICDLLESSFKSLYQRMRKSAHESNGIYEYEFSSVFQSDVDVYKRQDLSSQKSPSKLV